MGARRIAFVNEKGGSCKTTLTVSVGAYLASKKKERVLVLDLDPQGQAGKSLGLNVREIEPTIRDVLADPDMDPQEAIQRTRIPSLDIIVANKSLTNLPLGMDGGEGSIFRLAAQVQKLEGYDFVLFDSPPSLGLITLNILMATYELVIPVNCTFFALDGCAEIVDTVRTVREQFGKRDIEISLVVPTLYRPTNLAREVVEKLEAYFPGKIARTVLGYNVKIDEAQSHGLTIWEYSPNSPGAEMLGQLAEEVYRRG